jgi:hypothetical protein
VHGEGLRLREEGEVTPDGFIRYYYESESEGAPGLDPIDSTGRVYAEKCGACPSRTKNPLNIGGYACGRCGADWPFEDRFVLKGIVSRQVKVRGKRVSNVPSPSPGGSERRISRRVDVGVLLAHFTTNPRWRSSAGYYIANVLGYSVRELAEKTGASRSAVGRWISVARVEWSSRLEAAGLLPKSS